MYYILNQPRIFLNITQIHSLAKAGEAWCLTEPAAFLQLKYLKSTDTGAW